MAERAIRRPPRPFIPLGAANAVVVVAGGAAGDGRHLGAGASLPHRYPRQPVRRLPAAAAAAAAGCGGSDHRHRRGEPGAHRPVAVAPLPAGRAGAQPAGYAGDGGGARHPAGGARPHRARPATLAGPRHAGGRRRAGEAAARPRCRAGPRDRRRQGGHRLCPGEGQQHRHARRQGRVHLAKWQPTGGAAGGTRRRRYPADAGTRRCRQRRPQHQPRDGRCHPADAAAGEGRRSRLPIAGRRGAARRPGC